MPAFCDVFINLNINQPIDVCNLYVITPHALLIISQIDYCNSLLYGVNKNTVTKLQKIQNVLCRIVFILDETSHVTFLSTFTKLHWLPISYHSLFKYNLITFEAIKFSQPTYLSSLI